MRPSECRCENFPIESYACAEQLPSSYTPPVPPPAASVVPPSQDDGGIGVASGTDVPMDAANGSHGGPAFQVRHTAAEQAPACSVR